MHKDAKQRKKTQISTGLKHKMNKLPLSNNKNKKKIKDFYLWWIKWTNFEICMWIKYKQQINENNMKDYKNECIKIWIRKNELINNSSFKKKSTEFSISFFYTLTEGNWNSELI